MNFDDLFINLLIWFSYILIGITVLLTIVLIGTIFMTISAGYHTEKVSETVEMVALNDLFSTSGELHGTSGLFYGYLDGSFGVSGSFTGYRRTRDGKGYAQFVISAKSATLYETDKAPYFIYTRTCQVSNFSKERSDCSNHYDLYIPNGAILNKFELDSK